jgi:non-ribosomal peptide synthetase component F
MLGRVRRTTLEAQAHAELPFAILAEELAANPSGPLPGMPVVLIFHNELGSLARYRTSLAGGLEVEFLECHNGGAKRDWTFHVYEDGESIHGQLEYDVDLFTPASARAVAEGFARALSRVALEPDAPVRSLGEGT